MFGLLSQLGGQVHLYTILWTEGIDPVSLVRWDDPLEAHTYGDARLSFTAPIRVNYQNYQSVEQTQLLRVYERNWRSF